MHLLKQNLYKCHKNMMKEIKTERFELIVIRMSSKPQFILLKDGQMCADGLVSKWLICSRPVWGGFLSL